MAQIVDYFQENIEFTEGPFVLCRTPAGYRIECESKSHLFTVVLDFSILLFLEKQLYYDPNDLSKKANKPWVDHLNNLVREGKIVLEDTGSWVYVGDK